MLQKVSWQLTTDLSSTNNRKPCGCILISACWQQVCCKMSTYQAGKNINNMLPESSGWFLKFLPFRSLYSIVQFRGYKSKYTLKTVNFRDLRPVVQSWVSTNPGLKSNPVFYLVYFYKSASFKTSEPKLLLIQIRFLKKSFQASKQAAGEFPLNFTLT